jgi:Uma2 family endonuclease
MEFGMALHIPRQQISVDDYEKMIELGILTENDRVELIRGEIVEKMSIGDPHIACVNRLTRRFVRAVDDKAIVSIQNPIRLADSEPEPDLTLLAPSNDDYASGKAGPADVLLVIEVADSSLDYDRDVKGPIYAENGIADYWIVNLIDRCLEVYRQPQPDGSFAEVRTLKPGDSIDVLALPGLTVAVADLL